METDKMYGESGGGEAGSGGARDDAKAVGFRGFLLKTFDMVEDPRTDSLISWSADRTSFIIWDHNKFAAELLPKFFRHNNMASFVYQLNNYGFRKVSPYRHEYENQWFRPGKKHWLGSIKSRVQKSKMGLRRCGDLEKGDVEAEMEKLRAEQLTLKLEIQKLKQQQENMQKQLGNNDKADEEMVISSFSLKFIQLVKEKLEGVVVKKKPKMGDDEPESSRPTLAEKPGSLVEGKSERNAENSAFWKKIFEDNSDAENGAGEQPLQNSKIIAELDDMIASKIAMEGESLISKVAGLEGEEDEAHLELWT